MSLEDLRKEYRTAPFDPADVTADPISQFETWFADATEAGITEPNAMVVATVGEGGRPWQRHVLLKGLSPAGFTFYTNFTSRKGSELEANPACSLLFPWTDMARQVIVGGIASKVADDVADAYFAARPRESQLGAWASDQSTVIDSRATLEAQFAAATERFADQPIPRPPHWGGFEVAPESVEFWQGGEHRLHDRVVYNREPGQTNWTITRLNP